MIEIIPKRCVDMLPLSGEPISSWCDRSDLLTLLTAMFELGGYSFYGKYLFEEGKKRWEKTQDEFYQKAVNSQPAPAAEKWAEVAPDFRSESNFGLMAKYSILWNSADSAVLSESAFFSLPHILEAGSDLEASILLASNFYYKQALQMLRNYIEGMVLQLYFCNNIEDFEKWKLGAYRVPSFRNKKNGMLKKLQDANILPSDLAKQGDVLYEELNGCIHGSEKRLIHAGTFEGKWAGHILRYNLLMEWCEFFGKCVCFGIHTLRLSTNLWMVSRPQDKIYCDICHNETVADFEIDKTEVNAGIVSFKCKKCGGVQNFSIDWTTRHGYLR